MQSATDQTGRLRGVEYRQLDVFAPRPLSGNGLTVFFTPGDWPGGLMLELTREMRQFESVFLSGVEAPGPEGARVAAPGPARDRIFTPGPIRARIFTMDEELDFAGHPVLGAACAVADHCATAGGEAPARVELALNRGRVVAVDLAALGPGVWDAATDQGPVRFGPDPDPAALAPVLAGLGLAPADLCPDLPPAVASTGLDYLLLPVRPEALASARPRGADFEARLARLGAKFAYLLDPGGREGRTWDNAGLVEDVATGSAAGPVGGWLVRAGLARPGEDIRLAQGRFAGRPSELHVTVTAAQDALAARVSGRVWRLAAGRLDAGRPG
ncbi:MAG: PhzF family phenazine biosynthesis protein [Desulfovibrionaceae bacterium]